jgi:hypothetical protein
MFFFVNVSGIVYGTSMSMFIHPNNIDGARMSITIPSGNSTLCDIEHDHLVR